jgi:serine/threonine protein kinase
MNPDPNRAKAIFLEAVEKHAPDDWPAFLDRACAGQPDLRHRVEVLLEAHREAGTAQHQMPEAAAPVPGVATESDASPGTVIGPYKLIQEIGEGGMGTVWMAQQTEPVKRLVAVKLIKAGMDSKQVIARFEAERQALALMDHANIARVLDAGTTCGGRPYFVMDLVKGVPITRYCDDHRLTPRERLELFVPVCQAIQHAHQKGIIHRDLKPSNVLVALYDGKPVPKVIDFGVAKAAGQTLTEKTLVTGFGAIVGTLEYMSPEQAAINQLDIDTRSDIYSLGVLLYELLTGSPPFSRKELEKVGMLEMLRVIREQEPSKPSTKLSTAEGLPTLAANRGTEPAKLTKLLRGELDWIVMKALEKDRNRRYESANGFAQDLQRYLADEPVQACPPSRTYRLKKFLRRNKGPVLAVVLVLFALVGGMIGTTLGLLHAQASQERAQDAAWNAGQERDAALAAREQERLAKQAEHRQRDLADEEKEIAQAVRDFLLVRLLHMAGAHAQADALLRAGRSAAEAKENPTIRELLDRAAKELTPDKLAAQFPKQPRVQAEVLHVIGATYLGVGDYPSAIAHLTRALALRRQHLGPDDLATLMSLANLAVAYKAAGQPAQALPLLHECLERTKAKRGAHHPDTLSDENNLALTYYDLGESARALAMLKESLEQSKIHLGLDHPQTLGGMNNMAVTYQMAGQLPKALPLFRESLQRHQKKFGPDHPHTLTCMGTLGAAYHAAGQLAKAVPLLEETLEKRKDKLGADHPDTLLTMNNLALAYRDAGQLAKALPLLEEAVAKRRKKLGPDNPVTLTTMYSLAIAYFDDDQRAKGLALLEETVKRQKVTLPFDHPDLLDSLHTLSEFYEALGKKGQAEKWREKKKSVVGH